MRRDLAIAVAAGVAMGIGGYWLGRHQDPAPQSSAGPKVLYYRNPMGLPDTSPVPKKESMGMDYIPVYAGDADGASSVDQPGAIKISPAKVQQLGVRTAVAEARPLKSTIRAVAT